MLVALSPADRCPLLVAFLHRRRRAIDTCRVIDMRVRAGVATQHEVDTLSRARRALKGGGY